MRFQVCVRGMNADSTVFSLIFCATTAVFQTCQMVSIVADTEADHGFEISIFARVFQRIVFTAMNNEYGHWTMFAWILID